MKKLLLICFITFLGNTSLKAQVSKSNTTMACLSTGSADRTVVFTAGDFGSCTSLTDVDITIHYRVTDNLAGNPGAFGVHEDLDFDLISPTGTVLPLIQENRNAPVGCGSLAACDVGGICEASFVGSFTYIDGTVTLDQSASTPINRWNGGGCATVEAPTSGTYQPHEGRSLDVFNGENPIGTWTLRITDPFNNFGDVNCLMDYTLTVSCGATVGVSITGNTSVSCNGGSDGSLIATTTPGEANYTYVWSNGSTTSNTSSVTNTLTGLSAGTYTVTVTDNTGGTDTASATITQPTAVLAAASVDTNASCNGDTDGGATASATGGTMPYTYAWSNGATSAPITSLAAGTYTVTITDANGCTDSESTTITQPAAVVAAATVDNNVSCNGLTDGGATASATGGTMPYTYSWSNGATTAPITSLAAGTYTVTITDANGCTDAESTSITEPAAIVAAASVNNNVSCNGDFDGQLTASATGGTMPYTYTWNTGGTAAIENGLGAGTYSVTITDANGCTDAESTTVTEPIVIIAANAIDANVSCNGDSDGGATASATGGTMPYTYSWSNGATTAPITSLAAGTYTVTITDANGCTDTESTTITEPSVLIAATAVDNNVACNGLTDGGATGSATGGTMPYTYSWSNGATTAPITSLAAGTYTVTITDANGCTDSESTTITEPTAIVAAAAVDNNVSCNGDFDGQTTASATGGTSPYTYTWNTGATTATNASLSAGTYTVTITDANGCTDEESTTVTEPTAIVAAAAVDNNVSCNGDFDGQTTASATGGTSPYTYTWNTGATTATNASLSAGTYTVTITDANGCTDAESTTVTEPFVIIAANAIDANVSCNGDSDGGVTASATGGTMPYTYAWSTGATTAPITSLAAGTYTVTITDANGCTDEESTTITEPSILVAATVVDANQTPGDSDGAATGSATGGTMPYTYSWSNGATTASITGLTAGTYTLSVTDNNGCGPDTSEAIIIEDPLLSIDELEDPLNVSIYPNPVRDNITLSFDKSTQAQIQIIDLLGKIVTTEKVNDRIVNMNVSHLTSGIYFVKIDNNRNTGVYRFIKR